VLFDEPVPVPTRAESAAALADAGDHRTALALLDAIDDPGADVHALRGWCLENLSRLREAETAYREALALDVHNVEALEGLANVCFALARRREAFRHWAAAVEEIESRTELTARDLELAGWSLYRLYRLDEAERALRASLELDPSSPSARFDLALVLLAQGDVRALSEYEHAASLAGPAAIAVALDDLLTTCPSPPEHIAHLLEARR
jgi:tetratricopeptide (TPR) repeat protein